MSDKLTGIVIKVTGGFYYVEAAELIYECKARGIFRKNGNSPFVGDRVLITVQKEGYASIEEILPRKNSLTRPPLANIDVLVVVCSTTEPQPNMLIIDKMTAIAINNDIEPIIVVSKSDIEHYDEIFNIYSKTPIKVFDCSKGNKSNINELKQYLSEKISAFTGNSGVGKSTLLNSMFDNLDLETGNISQKLGRGKHTTRTVELFKFDNCYVADTPGFSTVDLERYEMIEKDNIQFCFPEFSDFIGNCKFTSCAHTCEKGCAIIDAVNNNVISKSRHISYVSMYNEVKNIKEWENRR